MNLDTNKGRDHFAKMEARRKKRIEKRFPTSKVKKDAKTSK